MIRSGAVLTPPTLRQTVATELPSNRPGTPSPSKSRPPPGRQTPVAPRTLQTEPVQAVFRFGSQSSLSAQRAQQLSRLTPRQQMVARKLLAGLPRKAIARELGIKLDTVGDHLKAIYTRHGVDSATELAALFLRSQ